MPLPEHKLLELTHDLDECVLLSLSEARLVQVVHTKGSQLLVLVLEMESLDQEIVQADTHLDIDSLCDLDGCWPLYDGRLSDDFSQVG